MSSQLLPLRHFLASVVADAASATFLRLRRHHSGPCCIFPSARRRPAFAIAASAAFLRRHAAFHIVAVADSTAFSRLPSPPLLSLPHSFVSVVAIAGLAAFSHGNAQNRLRYCCLCRILPSSRRIPYRRICGLCRILPSPSSPLLPLPHSPIATSQTHLRYCCLCLNLPSSRFCKFLSSPLLSLSHTLVPDVTVIAPAASSRRYAAFPVVALAASVAFSGHCASEANVRKLEDRWSNTKNFVRKLVFWHNFDKNSI